MKATNKPLVSIGMPLFNEEAFIMEALISLTSQKYENIEIFISDNSSTDNTQKICENYAAKHPQITYLRQENNIGAAANFRFVEENTQGKYFIWAAGHDLWSENFISETVKTLESNPTASIAFATSDWIDESSCSITGKFSGWSDTRGLSTVSRFFTIFWGNMHPVLGLINRKHLNRSKKFQGVLGADLILLLELSIHGDFVHAHRAHWSRRTFRSSETYTERVKRYRSAQYNLLDKNLLNRIPILPLPIEIIKVLIRSKLKILDKALCLLVLIPTMVVKFVISR